MNREIIMVSTAGRLITDQDVCFVGTGLPMIAAYTAKRLYAPGVTLLFESGILDPMPVDLAVGVGDFPLLTGATQLVGVREALAYLHGGRVTLGFLGAAQVDQYGNINTTVIAASGARPAVRLPGSGGANDIGSSAGRTVVMVRHERRKIVAHVDYVTTPGWGRSPSGKGPDLVITDLAVLRFDDNGRAYVWSVHEGVTWDEIQANTGFPLDPPDPWRITTSPSVEEVTVINRLDPAGFYLRNGGKFSWRREPRY